MAAPPAGRREEGGSSSGPRAPPRPPAVAMGTEPFLPSRPEGSEAVTALPAPVSPLRAPQITTAALRGETSPPGLPSPHAGFPFHGGRLRLCLAAPSLSWVFCQGAAPLPLPTPGWHLRGAKNNSPPPRPQEGQCLGGSSLVWRGLFILHRENPHELPLAMSLYHVFHLSP